MPNNWTWAGAPYDPRYGTVRADERAQQDNTSVNAEQSLYGVQHQTYQTWTQYNAAGAALTPEMLNEATNRIVHQGYSWHDSYDREQIQRIHESLYGGFQTTISWFDDKPVFYPMPKLKTKSKLPAWF